MLTVNPTDTTSGAERCRYLTFHIARLRSLVGRLQRSLSVDASDAFDQVFQLCESLLHDLAASQLESATARAELNARATVWDSTYESMPMACVEINDSGTIVRANRSAGQLLNTSGKYLEDRLLMLYAEDREAFGALMRRLRTEHDQMPVSFMMRPRERAPIQVDVSAVSLAHLGATASLWFLIPSGRGRSRQPKRRTTRVLDTGRDFVG
jgi:PAS domain-containing protein